MVITRNNNINSTIVNPTVITFGLRDECLIAGIIYRSQYSKNNMSVKCFLFLFLRQQTEIYSFNYIFL
jgi:hypothetical protein